jgi:integrase
MMASKKRRFGRVRRLPSGRYQARYPGPDGTDRPAPNTFKTKTDANVWLTSKEAEILSGDWIDPDAGKVKFGTYAETWINDQVLKPLTEGLYRSLLKNHLAPTFGNTDLGDIRTADIRQWRKERLKTGPRQKRPFGPVTVAKSYRLMHAIMNTAVEDGLIKQNPCRIKGAGQEHSDERPVVPIATFIELLDKVPARHRALLLLATFANLRFGELAGLRRNQLDLDKCVVHVKVSTAETDTGMLLDDDPKSQAGKRTVSFASEIVPELRSHLERFAQPGPSGLVFIGPKGGRLRRSNFRKFWNRARESVGMPELHFHDLRHTGNTMAASQGASLRELMERMGHSSPRAALIYLHATRERDEKIAKGMGEELRNARKGKNRSGTQRARGRKNAP